MPASFSLSPLHSDVNHETSINEQQYRIPRAIQQCRRNQTMSRNALSSSSVCLRVCSCVRDRTDLIFSLEESFERNSISMLALDRCTNELEALYQKSSSRQASSYMHRHTRTYILVLAFVPSSFHANSRARRSSCTPVHTDKI